jgi:hypothetical protein
MKKVPYLILGLLGSQLTAQKLFIYPRTVTAPRGTYQTVTAIVTGAKDKTVTWSASGGKIVGMNPCVVNEPCTIALFATEPGKYVLKATSNADHSLSAVSDITVMASPTPVKSHPRLALTEEMVAQLRTKDTAGNVAYQSIKDRAKVALQHDNAIWNWTCHGGSGLPNSDQSQSYKEVDANLFAVLSEIAPSKQERDQWGCYGHDVFMTMANYVVTDKLDLSKGNHWSDSALALTLTPDWLMGGGYISTPGDVATIHKYLAKIAYQQVTNVYNGAQAVIGKYNSLAQFNQADEISAENMRAMGNNYTQSRVLYLVASALTFNDDPTDDPPLTNTCNATRYQVCPDGTAGSLHAYWSYLTGGMLYKDWANMEEASVVQQAYNAAYKNVPSQPKCNTRWHTPIPCLGGARGGESSEGTSYGGSLASLRRAMDAAHTAGYDDPLLYGPQMSIATMSYWDLRYIADLTLLTGLSGAPSESSRWNYLTNGDSLNYYTYPSNYATEAEMLTSDSYVGRTDRTAALEWIVKNTAFGMVSGKVGGCKFYCGLEAEIGNDYGSSVALDLVLSAPADGANINSSPEDPRSALPTEWYDAGNQHLVTRTGGWTTVANTIFSYYCTNTQIDHEHQFCGGFDVYSNGEYITKGRMEFNDYNDEFSLARNKNTLVLFQSPERTTCASTNSCNFTYWQSAAWGGQWWHGYQGGLDTLLHSELPGYVAAIAEDHHAYNGGWGGFATYFSGITAASRSLIYLRGSNKLITYDRGATGANAWDKANYLVVTGKPTFDGKTASWHTRSGKQKVLWTSLEPTPAAPQLEITYTDADAKNDWEIYGRIKADAGSVASARFLSVLEWGPANFSGSSATRVTSSAGTNFEGALVGSSLVMFMRDWPGNMATMTYPASGATTHYISDLTPNASYNISGTGAPASAQTDNAGVLTFSAGGAGDITITALKR